MPEPVVIQISVLANDATKHTGERDGIHGNVFECPIEDLSMPLESFIKRYVEPAFAMLVENEKSRRAGT